MDLRLTVYPSIHLSRIREQSGETARAFPLDEAEEARAYARGLAVTILAVLEERTQCRSGR